MAALLVSGIYVRDGYSLLVCIIFVVLFYLIYVNKLVIVL